MTDYIVGMNKILTKRFMGKTIHPDFKVVDDGIYYLEKDVKSAVEWLKENIKLQGGWTKNQVCRLIDEAFPDFCPTKSK